MGLKIFIFLCITVLILWLPFVLHWLEFIDMGKSGKVKNIELDGLEWIEALAIVRDGLQG